MTLDEIVTPLKTVWRFDYDAQVAALRDLYEVAKKQQWNAATDVPWDMPTDPTKVGNLAGPNMDILDDLECVDALPEDTKIELDKRLSAWTLSQFLHSEQGALLCTGQLVEAVPDMDGKFYAATQVIDEARHVEVFSRYITRLDRIYPIMPSIKTFVDSVLQADLWQMKCVGMQVITESLALGSFSLMRKATEDPLLMKVVELAGQDESRHVSYGVIYMKEELSRMPEADRDRVEDFAWHAVEILGTPDQYTSRTAPLLGIMDELGVDLAVVAQELKGRLGNPQLMAGRPNPVRDNVVPQLERIGLITDRTADKYRSLNLLS